MYFEVIVEVGDCNVPKTVLTIQPTLVRIFFNTAKRPGWKFLRFFSVQEEHVYRYMYIVIVLAIRDWFGLFSSLFYFFHHNGSGVRNLKLISRLNISLWWISFALDSVFSKNCLKTFFNFLFFTNLFFIYLPKKVNRQLTRNV